MPRTGDARRWALTLGVGSGMNPHLAALGISVEALAARGLSECKEASNLVVAEVGADGTEHLLVATAAEAWRKLKVTAAADSITLVIASAFRSVERQAEIVRRKLDAGASVVEVLSICAPPGFSEHHTGRAIDLSTPGSPPLELEFEQTPAFAWLTAQARSFGFRLSYPVGNSAGYQYEPWHWCFHDTRRDSAANPQPARRNA